MDYEVRSVDYKKSVNLFGPRVLNINVATFQELVDLIRECKVRSEYSTRLRLHWMNSEVLELIKEGIKLI